MMVRNPNKQLSVETDPGKMVRKNKPNPLQESEQKTSKPKQEVSEVCPECMSEDVHRKGPRNMRCNVCYHEWV